MLVGLATALGAIGNPRPHCDEAVEAGEYRLCLRVMNAGTRSEGRVGRLYFKNAEVKGTAVGQEIEAEGPKGPVRFRFHGWERPHLWSISGWDVVSAVR